MASANSLSPLEKLAWHLEHHAHSAWDRFSEEQRTRMVEDDLFAGKSVSLVLISVITAGLLMTVLTLLIVLATT